MHNEYACEFPRISAILRNGLLHFVEIQSVQIAETSVFSVYCVHVFGDVYSFNHKLPSKWLKFIGLQTTQMIRFTLSSSFFIAYCLSLSPSLSA